MTTRQLLVGPGKPRPFLAAAVEDLEDGRWLLDDQGHAVLRLQQGPLAPWVAPVAAPREPTPTPPPPSAPFHVPFRSKADIFVGRKGQLEALHRLLSDGRRTLVGQAAGIHGMGGVGKTQLAVEYCWRFRDSYPDGVVWFNVTEDRQAQWASFAIRELGGRGDDKPENLAGLTRRWLDQHRDYLLVLDNVEENTDVDAWLPVEPGRVLATSRARLTGPWSALSLDMLDRDAAVELLVQTSGVRGTPRDDPEALHDLCVALCDFPLAIEIAGAFLDRYERVTVAAYLDEIGRRGVRALHGSGTISATRHQASVVATLALDRQQLADRADTLDLVEVMALWPSHTIEPELLCDMAGLDAGLARDRALSEATRLSLLKELGGVIAIHPFLQEVVRQEVEAPRARVHRARMARALSDWLLARDDRANMAQVVALQAQAVALADTEGPTELARGVMLREVCRHQAYGGDYRAAVAAGERALVHLEAHGDIVELADGEATVGSAHIDAADYDRGDRLTSSALATVRAHPDVSPALRLRVLASRVQCCTSRGQLEEGGRLAQELVAFANDAFPEGGPELAVAYDTAANVLLELGLYQESLEHSIRACDLWLAARPEGHPDLMIAKNSVATKLSALGRPNEALEYQRDALAIGLRTLGPDHPVVATARHNVGAALVNLGRHEQSLDYLQTARATRLATLGPDHPDLSYSDVEIGTAYSGMGRYQEALKYTQRAMEVSTGALGLDHPTALVDRVNLSVVLTRMGQIDEALALGHEALASMTRVLGRDHPRTADAMEALGSVLGDSTRIDEALPLLEEAAEIRRQKFGDAHPGLGHNEVNIGVCHIARGDHSTALTHLSRGVDLLRAAMGGESHAVGVARGRRGQCLVAMGRLDEAEEELEASIRIVTVGRGDGDVDLASVRHAHASLLFKRGELAPARAELLQVAKALEAQLGPDHPMTRTALANLKGATTELNRSRKGFRQLSTKRGATKKQRPKRKRRKKR